MPTISAWPLGSEARFRTVLCLVLLTGAGAVAFVVAAFVISFVWPDPDIATPREHLFVGSKYSFAYDEPVHFAEGDFWLVRRAGDRFFALSNLDPRRDVGFGCTVPWRPEFRFTNPATNQETQGWFRNGCHAQTYDIEGHCVFGPCLTDMDRYTVTFNGDRVTVSISRERLIRTWRPSH